MKSLSTAFQTELAADVREPRYMVEVDFPSGLELLVTGDPANISSEIGAPSHVLMDVAKIDARRVNVTFFLGDQTFIADLFSTALGQKSVRVWVYYELPSGTEVGWCDVDPVFSGKVSRVRGGLEAATIEATLEEYLFPSTRINPTGGFNWLTVPQVLTIGNAVITVSRRGLR